MVDKFEEDLSFLLSKLEKGVGEEVREKLCDLKNKLLQLHETNVVKINHSVMELVCAKHLLLKGYEVDVEHLLEKALTCDLYGVKGNGTLIVEIETGFVPPEHAIDPTNYSSARIASKITRYSRYSHKFALAIPPYYILQIQTVFTTPPRERKAEDLMVVKNLCDPYYKNPPVSIEEIKNARLHIVYLINVDDTIVEEIDPETYVRTPTKHTHTQAVV